MLFAAVETSSVTAQTQLLVEIQIQLLRAVEPASGLLRSHLDVLYALLAFCHKRAILVRADVFVCLEQWRFLQDDTLTLPVLSVEQYKRQQEYLRLITAAASDPQVHLELSAKRDKASEELNSKVWFVAWLPL